MILKKEFVIRFMLFLALLFTAGSVSVSAQRMMPKEQAAHFCKLLIDDGKTIAPLSYHAHRLLTQKNDSLTEEQMFTAFIFHDNNWLQMRFFPHTDDKGNITWYAPSDNIPENVDTEHIKYIQEFFPRLSVQVEKGNWKTVDAFIDKIIEYQCRFSTSDTASSNTVPTYIIYILILLFVFVPVVAFFTRTS